MPDEAGHRCGSCRHWHNPWTEHDHVRVYAVEPEEHPRWGTCELIGLAARPEDRKGLPAFTIDGSEFMADLHVRDDFGCVLWSATPPVFDEEFGLCMDPCEHPSINGNVCAACGTTVEL